MQKKTIRQISSLITRVVSLIILFFCLFIGYLLVVQNISSKKNISEKLQVAFLDVGQGDASFIRIPTNKIILIDGGPDNLVLYRLAERMAFYERKIEAIIISHFHDDHIIGLIEILRRYKVKQIIFASNLESSSLAQLLFEEATKRKTKIISLNSSSSFNLGSQCEAILFNPLILKVKENGNNSLLTKLDCVDFRVLFSGDNEKEVEKMLLDIKFDLEADIFKASHHGSKTSNNIDFLKAVNPEIIVISVGADNRFNHPAPETLKTATDLEMRVFRTDENGSLDFLLTLNSY